MGKTARVMSLPLHKTKKQCLCSLHAMHYKLPNVFYKIHVEK